MLVLYQPLLEQACSLQDAALVASGRGALGAVVPTTVVLRLRGSGMIFRRPGTHRHQSLDGTAREMNAAALPECQ